VLNIEADGISLSHENSASFATKPLQFPVVTKMDVIRHLSLKLNSISSFHLHLDRSLSLLISIFILDLLRLSSVAAQ